MKSHILKIDPAESEQGPNDQSYIGGKPTLPEDWEIPLCKLCGREQTFFFQVAFPEGYEWAGSSLAVFACTSCASEDYAIPELLDVLQEAVIPDGFLETYQTNFRFFVFGTLSARIRNDYIEKIQFKRWLLEPAHADRDPGNKMGGLPYWLLEDESPLNYRSTVSMAFLLQIVPDFKFDIVENAPPQMAVDFFGPQGSYKPSQKRFYELFIGDALFLFGTSGSSEHLVYAVVQTD